LKAFFSERANIQILISVAALAVSVSAILFSVHSYRTQFELDMRPFVGVSMVEAIPLPKADVKQSAGIAIEATIKNVGKLPADDVHINLAWKIVRAGGEEPILQETRQTYQLTIFPGIELKSTAPFQGALFERYLADPAYDVVVEYDIDYSNPRITNTWKSSVVVRYNKTSNIRISAANGN
jgi:hypothetical protein